MKFYKGYDQEYVQPVYAELDEEKNKYITETAGYVPLEVKLKRFEEAGIQQQFHDGEFTSTDYRNIYLNPDFEITPEDELEDIEEKLTAREQYINKIRKAKSDGKIEPAAQADTSEGGTVDPEPEKANE